MAVDHIRYDLLAQDALRGVVRTVLADTAKNGPPGEHHFYISFDTRAEGVHLSPRMLAQYPKEMTIVLQHQFWDLVVTEGGFEVGLSFGGIPERLVVPFAAVKGFFDPSVQFGLRFEELTQESVAQEDASGRAGQSAADAPAQSKELPALPPIPSAANQAVMAEQPAKPEAGAEVVRLDRFRKK
jgi:uncharacterized protein